MRIQHRIIRVEGGTGISANLCALALGLLICLAPRSAGAGEFDGSRDVMCATEKGIEYHGNSTQRPFDPESVGLPRTFVVAFKEQRIRPIRDSVIRRNTRIERVQIVEDKLMLQGVNDGMDGVDDGVGWTMAILRGSGRFVVTASGGNVGYIVFGGCRAADTQE